jgi:hypothetical protein
VVGMTGAGTAVLHLEMAALFEDADRGQYGRLALADRIGDRLQAGPSHAFLRFTEAAGKLDADLERGRR